MFCGDCGVKDGNCQGKSNYVGADRGQCNSSFGRIFWWFLSAG